MRRFSLTALLIPSLLNAATVKLSWDPVEFVGAYHVHYRVNGGEWIQHEVGTNNYEFTTDIAPGSVVEARVRGCYNYGTQCPEGSWSNTVSAYYSPKLEKPGNFKIRIIIDFSAHVE